MKSVDEKAAWRADPLVDATGVMTAALMVGSKAARKDALRVESLAVQMAASMGALLVVWKAEKWAGSKGASMVASMADEKAETRVETMAVVKAALLADGLAVD